MMDFWVPLLIRMVVTAAVVLAATIAAERAGPFWAAMIGAFPTSAGPAYVMLALKEDAEFVSASAIFSLAGMVAIAPFVVAIIYIAPRTNVIGTLVCAIVVWAVFAFPVSQIIWTPFTAVAANIIVFSAGFWLTHRMTFETDAFTLTKPRWTELLVRAFVVGFFVAAVVTLSDALGTVGTGMGAVFPIVFLSLTAILHIRLGGAAVAMTMQNALRVVSVMILSLLTVHYGVLWWGKAIGLSAALVVSIIWATIFIVFNRHKTAGP